ncbi:hypothetical protein [Wolbachia endosymbiont (group E) of Neria commutata]|uniref:hypothetical protein n=1 Tax=Wolbachia endosymbiont (group E) of Neria commutata TaxID=3066149 RepID=UPI003132C813
MKSLSNETDGKFKSDRLFHLLQDESTARKAIENRIVEVVNKKNKTNDNKYYDDGKNINAALIQVKKDDTEIDNMVEKDLKSQLLLSIKKCMKKLEFNKKDAPGITDSIMAKFKNRKKENKSELSVLLEEIVVEELVDFRMELFYKYD